MVKIKAVRPRYNYKYWLNSWYSTLRAAWNVCTTLFRDTRAVCWFTLNTNGVYISGQSGMSFVVSVRDSWCIRYPTACSTAVVITTSTQFDSTQLRQQCNSLVLCQLLSHMSQAAYYNVGRHFFLTRVDEGRKCWKINIIAINIRVFTFYQTLPGYSLVYKPYFSSPRFLIINIYFLFNPIRLPEH